MGRPALPSLPDPLRVHATPGRVFFAKVKPPGSKSLTNRALLLAALAHGRSTIRGALVDADDASRMIEAVRVLGARVEQRGGDTLNVEGVGGRWPNAGVTLDLENAGTATRFLAAAAILAPGPVTITGNERMRQRPIGELSRLLERLGAHVETLGSSGCPPVRLTPPEALAHAPILDVPTTTSSQFISALLLIGPWLPGGLTLRLTGEVTSASYVSMTLSLLDRLGAGIRMSEDLRVIRVTGSGGVRPFDLEVEPDASGATPFWAAAALIEGAKSVVLGLDADSLQGDAAVPEILLRMGAGVERRSAEGASSGWIACTGGTLSPINADLSSMPDAAMSLAVVCAFAPGRSVLRGLRTLRVKETDRIEALRVELAKIGVRVEADAQGSIAIVPPPGGVDVSPGAEEVVFETYRDHRMAMSLALVGLRRPNVLIRDPGCVAKTYPAFWEDFARVTGETA